MDQEQLETFLTLAETSSFTKTSEMMHVVQSTITVRIKALETQLGRKLFERGTRYVRLTPDGHAFLDDAGKIVGRMRQAVTELQIRKEYDYRIVIGGLNTIWDSSIYTLIEKLCGGGRVSVRMVTDHSSHLINRLQEGTIDVAFVLIPPRSPVFGKVLFRNERIILVGNSDRYQGVQTLSREQLLHSHKLLYQNWGIAYEDWFKNEFGKYATVAARVDHSGLALKLIMNLDCLGFMLESVAREWIKKGKLKPIDYQSKTSIPDMTIYLTYLKSRKKEFNLQSFVAFVRKNGYLMINE
ncbi:LysR family transcriptional regulator [Sporolactobacillus pectinivorans]|uniref:LysR family transcriptional regulator n=1 Tax=Sporolactobacillus pectinivorans TaxID=1591408 RepID=UPI000C258AA0|nr:LysR family transcriptional regulator [Sporolactobacillus pectinivorans]